MTVPRGLGRFLLICVVLALACGPTRCQEEEKEGPSRSSSLMGMLLRPLKLTIEHARRFLGDRMDDVSGGVDTLRLSTFKVFMQLYNKTYSPEELPRRMALFFQRRKWIEDSLRSFHEGRSMFAMRENAFIDWDEDELKGLAGVSLPSKDELAREELDESARFKRSLDTSANYTIDADADDDPNLSVQQERVPAQKDWRASGCVSEPINQMKCGACYAISTMGALETMHCLNKISAPILSSQQIVDCSTPRAGYSNYGCDGGWPTRVLKYLQDVGVAARERCYPFVRRQNSCKLRQVSAVSGCTVAASPTNSALRYKVLHNERDILYHVAKTGPVVTVMKASDKFLYYGSGIFDDPSCSRRRDDVDHGIVIVGYGRENNVDYWLIKNSWGVQEWGEQGYGRYRRGTNACSIGHWGWVITS